MKDTIIILVCIAIIFVFICFIFNSYKNNVANNKANTVLNSINYEFAVNAEDWPDVIFKIEFKGNKSQNEKLLVYKEIFDFVNRYNQKCEEQNLDNAIHYIAEVDDFNDPENILSLHIDFGWADPTILYDVFEVINKPEFEIASVTVE